MMPHITDPVLYAYQYQLYAHLLGCVVIVALALATGLKPSKIRRHGSRLAVVGGFAFVFVQIPVTMLRMNTALSGEMSFVNPFDVYINFFWSPMCTVCILWLYLSHLASSCSQCEMAIPKTHVNPNPQWAKMGWCIAAGIGTSYIVHYVLAEKFSLDDMWLLRLMFGIAIAAAPLEIIFFRARKNEVRFFNYTWSWFLGTWLFFLPKI